MISYSHIVCQLWSRGKKFGNIFIPKGLISRRKLACVLISVIKQYQKEWHENSGGRGKVAWEKVAMVKASTKSNQHLISPYNITAE